MTRVIENTSADAAPVAEDGEAADAPEKARITLSLNLSNLIVSADDAYEAFKAIRGLTDVLQTTVSEHLSALDIAQTDNSHPLISVSANDATGSSINETRPLN